MSKSTRPPSHTKNLDALPAECPICRYTFGTGILGWDKHVGTISKHPNWHPELTSPSDRQAAFAAEFPEFFGGALTPSRRRPLQARANPPVAASGVAPRVEQGHLLCPTCGAPLAYAEKANGSRGD